MYILLYFQNENILTKMTLLQVSMELLLPNLKYKYVALIKPKLIVIANCQI